MAVAPMGRLTSRRLARAPAPPPDPGQWERIIEVLQAVPDALLVVAEDGTVSAANKRAEQVFGAAPGELVGRPVTALLPSFRNLPDSLIDRGAVVTGHGPNGSEFPAEIQLSPLTMAEGSLVLVTVRDVSVRRRAEEALIRRALHDSLTGLPNRALLLDRVAVTLARAGRTGARPAVLFLDLDRFKLVNDSRGHDAGDALLQGVARRLQDVLRPGDTVARFGGDEFVIVCDDLPDEEEAQRVGGRVLRALREPFALRGEELFLSGSLGIALAGPDSQPESLLRDADAAMYRAKDRGRGRCEVFDQNMREQAADRLSLQGDLHRALDRDELSVAYQPVIDLGSGLVVAAEALIRWEHPTRGWVSPCEFVPAAEDGGLIVPIGNWVLEESVRRWAGWRDRFPDRAPLVLHINLSPRQLHQMEFLGFVHNIMQRYDVEPSSLCFELTETVLMEDAEAQGSTLAELRNLGVQLALDDFGTGYSSLTYLKRFPVDTIKIDQSFVRDLGTDAFDSAIVASIIGLAHAVGLNVVAEGVEHGGQRQRLEHLACDQAQGYLFSRARPAQDFDWLLSATYPATRPMVTAE